MHKKVKKGILPKRRRGIGKVPVVAATVLDTELQFFVQQKSKRDNLIKALVPARIQGSNIGIPCVRCGQKGARFLSVQKRSMDEGQSIFYICSIDSCGATWNQY